MFRRILIANRGEIACRIMRTCRGLGVETVAVYSEADADALHARTADAAYRLGPPAPAESYLNIPALVAAIRASGADAVHPGYGFLSERAEFAEAVTAAGAVFIGPPPAAIRAMGVKDAAKDLMRQAGVPVVPGWQGPEQDEDTLARAAAALGYPVLIKAVAGGGGKGMRRVDAPDQFPAALASAKREAAAAFGDDRVLIERYVARPRHIEVQVFADAHGQALHLGERDCSIQRRHQKVLEEAPAPGMTAEVRAAIGDAAVRAALAIGYRGAGTVEFIADASGGLRADRIWFMEMNTRLQVEHPVTEAVTGLDLVEWQIRIAAGQPLPLRQDQVRLDGHAIEVRVYAEDADRGFLPATGRITLWSPPAGVRIDAGVAEGDAVTPHYDPMLAKLVVHGTSRMQAVGKLRLALQSFAVGGCVTNLPFLARLVEAPAFAAADLDTAFLERNQPVLLPPGPDDDTLQLAAAWLAAQQPVDADEPWSALTGWRLYGRAPTRFVLRHGEQEWRVHAPDDSAASVQGARVDLALAEKRIGAWVVRDGDRLTVIRGGRTVRLELAPPLGGGPAEEGLAGALAAPLPGKVIQVLAAVGAAVVKGQPLVVVEAMKMEHTIAAPKDGFLQSLAVTVGQQVQEGEALAVLADQAS